MLYKFILLGIILIIISLLIFGFRIQETWHIFNTPTSSPNVRFVPERSIIDPINVEISPDIKPATREGWLTFKYPTEGYSFEFPSEWNIKVFKNRYVKDEVYEVSLIYFENGERFYINFMTGGRGAPNFDYETIENKNLGAISVTWNKMFRNNQLFEAVVSFPNREFGEYFVGLYVYFPPTNQGKIEQIVNEIVATLKTT